uniref:Uncharacterized protein n=1 Tax=Octactis speculum TaxID=3111310 RepID=A0A7S2F1G4_9STRA|mmetsp:Transcript_11012/g.14540  ORF Transcript_11012/g.14540 Transcript_11012/m.14540 type:complete len:366 (+) Transcript_11012:64-1161(+)
MHQQAAIHVDLPQACADLQERYDLERPGCPRYENGYSIGGNTRTGRGFITASERANSAVISIRSLVLVLAEMAAQEPIGTIRDRLLAYLASSEMYLLFPMRNPSRIIILRSDLTTRQGALDRSVQLLENIIFLDIQNEEIFLFLHGEMDTRYNGLNGVLQDSSNVFEHLLSAVQGDFAPFGLFAPAAFAYYNGVSPGYDADGMPFPDDVDRVLRDILLVATHDDLPAQSDIVNRVNAMTLVPQCSRSYIQSKALMYWRHAAVMDMYHQSGIPDRDVIVQGLLVGHHLNTNTLGSYIHKSVITHIPSRPFKFQFLDVCFVREYTPGDWRAWIASNSNASNILSFPGRARIVSDFKLLDGFLDEIVI